MKTFEVLEKALGLIEDERNWWVDGDPAHRGDYCALLALGEVEIESFKGKDALAQVLGKGPGHGHIVHFNDTHSHAEVVALFQKAIRREKQKAGVPLDLPDDEKTGDRKPEEVAA